MKFTEQITQPGFVMELMTAAFILSFLILIPIFFIVVLPHVLYHHGPNWSNAVYFAPYLVVLVIHLWKQRKSHRAMDSN